MDLVTNGIRSMSRAVAVALLALCAGAAFAADQDRGTGERAPAVHRITQSASYMMIDPIYTTVTDGEKPQGLLMVGIGLDVPEPGLRADVNRLMPVLRDAYVRSLLIFTASSVRALRQPDVAAIADRLQRVTDRTLGRRGAKLLLAQVAMRLTH
ncbi:MAG: hypothetical protein KGJ78_09210 [Alphaproteobacteria bacterium]|nr:hypothetical protein [Alphaproteobacteria bacterium]